MYPCCLTGLFFQFSGILSCEHVEVGWGHNRCPRCPPIRGSAPLLQVLFGTADGQVIVMDCHGRMLAHILLHESDGILSMSWNYPAFLVEDSSESDTDSDDYSPPQGGCAGRAGRSRTPPHGGTGRPATARRLAVLGGVLSRMRGRADPVSDLDGPSPRCHPFSQVAWPSTGFPRRRARLMAVSVPGVLWGPGT